MYRVSRGVLGVPRAFSLLFGDACGLLGLLGLAELLGLGLLAGETSEQAHDQEPNTWPCNWQLRATPCTKRPLKSADFRD